jgi:predicted GIY-YIG superfamily endonuclease
MIHCYLLRFAELGRTLYYRGITANLQYRKEQHQKGHRRYEGAHFLDMRHITSYCSRGEAMAWENRVSSLSREDKAQLWAAGVDV